VQLLLMNFYVFLGTKKCIMKNYIFILIIFIWGCNNNAAETKSITYTPKDFTVSGKVNKILSGQVYLYNFYGHKTNKIDSAQVDAKGNFSFNLSKNLPVGIYRIIMGKTLKAQFLGGGEQYVDFIFNYDDIKFETHFDFPYDSMKVLSSEENKYYYEYVNSSDDNKDKMDVLMYSLRFYPKTDDFHKTLSKQYKKVYDDYDKFLNKITKKQGGSFLSKLIAFEKLPYADPLLSKDSLNNVLKRDFFGKADFTDTILLHSQAIPEKVLKYLSFYRNENYSQEVQEAEFIKAIDAVMEKTIGNENVYNSILDYFIEGFERFDMELILLHLYDNYVLGNSCMDDERANSIKDKSEAIKLLGKGQTAPDFSFTKDDGNTINLKNIQAEYTLVLFWASWCNHCTKMLPQINEIYNETARNKFEVIAISLDKEKDVYNDYLRTNNFKWHNYTSAKGWDCPIAHTYYIHATPTMLLLDKDKKIVAKPLNVRDLNSYLQY